jgi:alginate O-acetyltransferase complex protein AlgI
MLFHSLEFAIFFPIVFILYLLLEFRWQNRLLLLASYIFYGAWDWRYLFLILLSTGVDYYCGFNIAESKEKNRQKWFLRLSIVTNLSMLGIFKYFDFFSTGFHSFLHYWFGLSGDPFLINVILPIGISFYTFQTMSYSIDIYNKKVEPAKNFLDFALYVSFFPQLIAGPIERASHLLPQILKPRKVSKKGFFSGAYLFLWGVFIKVYIADNLAYIVDPVFVVADSYNGAEVLIATYAFSIQIYGDFAGYSFMAIGLAQAMGIELMENFRRPYFAKNISEFWRRWHISLSSWIRDYVYIPLGGSHSSVGRHTLNLFFSFFLCGLWHGAGYNFILFGIYHGVAIGLYYINRRWWDKMPGLLQIILMFQVVAVGWLLFRVATVGQGLDMFNSLLFNFVWHDGVSESLLKLVGFSIVLFIMQILKERSNNPLVVFEWPKAVRYGFIVLCP